MKNLLEEIIDLTLTSLLHQSAFNQQSFYNEYPPLLLKKRIILRSPLFLIFPQKDKGHLILIKCHFHLYNFGLIPRVKFPSTNLQ